MADGFRNDDRALRAKVERVLAQRRALGLEGLVGGLETVILSVEPDRLESAAADFLNTTGYFFATSIEGDAGRGCVLALPGSADFLLRARNGPGPFAAEPLGPKSQHLPHTRVETLVFACADLPRYVEIQKRRGVRFLTPGIVRSAVSLFIQTAPSAKSALSFGFVQWLGSGLRQYVSGSVRPGAWSLSKPDSGHLRRVGVFDHASVRVHARDRDAAILEFLGLTNYEFSMSVYVDSLNSITNVARFPGDPYAMVITSGLGEADPEHEGPTERFIRNYGRRIHHLAFRTEGIVDVFAGLKAQGRKFLLELVGSPEEGLRQTFSRPSPETLLVNEYIERYPGFDGFFTKSNVTRLTLATENQ